MKPMLFQTSIIFATLAFCSIIFFGCGSTTVINEVSASLAPGTLDLQQKSMSIDSKTYHVDEGTIIVLENSADSLSRKIALPIKRIRSLNPNSAEPIFWLNGGPGMSNMKFQLPSRLLERHDIVLVGYRGVDGSVQLGSDEMITAMKGVGNDLLSDSTTKVFARELDSFLSKIQSRGVDIQHYTMVQVIHDMETARKAFGYNTINLLSASYGTRIALLYGYLHENIIHRSIMVGANPPGRFIWEAKKIDAQIAYYDRLYQNDTVRSNGKSLFALMKKALSEMPSRWSLFSLDPGKIKVATFAMLYHKKTSALVFHSYAAAAEGDYSGLYLVQLAYDMMLPSMMVWGEFFAKGVSADFYPEVDYAARLNDSTTIMGSPLSYLIWQTASLSGKIQPVPTELRTLRRSPVHTLIISGSVDFSTPAEYATNELLPSLPNGKQIILKEMGHVNDLMTLQPEAFAHTISKYYDEGIVDESRFTYDAMDFDTPIDLPFWGKVLYPFVALASLL